MTRWAVVGPTYPFRGGIAHFSTLLVQHLRRRHPVAFYSFRRQYPSWLFPGRGDRDPSRSPLRTETERLLDPLNPVTWLRTYQRIRRFGPDCLILFWWVPYWAPTWWALAGLSRSLAHIPVLYVCHNVLPHESTPGSRWLARQVLSRADAWLVLSREQQALLEQLLPGRPIAYTPHPVYTPLRRQPLDQMNARRVLSLESHTPVLLFFGLVRPYKGLSVLLQAMPRVVQTIGARLLIVGEFWEPRAQYEAQIAALGLGEAVCLVDRYVPDEELGFYFAAADVVVLPYLHATQSGVAQLAFGFGRPVIASRVGDLPDRIQDGENGFLVPPGDSTELSQALIRFFSEGLGPRFQSSVAAKREGHSWDQLVDALETVLSDRR